MGFEIEEEELPTDFHGLKSVGCWTLVVGWMAELSICVSFSEAIVGHT